MSTLEWGSVGEADLPQLASLARACLRRDGGLPQLAGEEMLRQLFLTDTAIGGRDDTGELVAVAALSWDAQGRRTASGLVHPGARRQGHGEALVDWAREHAGGTPLRVVAETMSLEAEELFASSGLRRTWAETVMRHKLKHIPTIPRPEGLRVLAFGDETAPLFFEAYRRSFAERPGFPDPTHDQWLESVRGEPGFRPGDSRVAVGADDVPAGFVLLVDNWIDAVGTVPQWRGRRLGAHLVVRSLTVFARTGEPDAWLCVSADNPARSIYERLGFRGKGTRARYEERPPDG
jgi:mycothiol synthase